MYKNPVKMSLWVQVFFIQSSLCAMNESASRLKLTRHASFGTVERQNFRI